MSRADHTMRLAKFLARAGVASRRKSEEEIKAGRIAVNDRIITSPATNVDPEADRITYRGTIVSPRPDRYYALHKPPGYTCSASDPHAGKLVSELFPPDESRLFTIGRLDRDSEGLILCTNDGDFGQRIGHPSHEVQKVYHVKVKGCVRARDLKQLESGVTEGGEKLTASAVKMLRRRDQNAWLEFVLVEGKKREVRRMCKVCGWPVQRLRRVAIGPLELGNLKPGQIRPLTSAELRALEKAAAGG